MVIRKAGMVGIALATLPIDALALALLFGGPDPAPPHGTARPPAVRPAPHPAPPAARPPAPTVPRPPAPLTGWRLYPYDPEGWADTPADLDNGPDSADDRATV
jgi:hypothetical protein